MRFQCLVCLLLAGLAYGQATPPATPTSATPPAAAKAEHSASAATDKAPEVKVGPDDTVITLKGFCADATQQGDACKTVITRAQFENVHRGREARPRQTAQVRGKDELCAHASSFRGTEQCAAGRCR